MADQIRLMTIQRGYDPREFTLVLLGGAGPVHGVALAEELELELVSSAYISLAARPLLAAEIAAIQAPAAATTRLDRLHLMASAFETVIAAGPCERSAELARKALFHGVLVALLE